MINYLRAIIVLQVIICLLIIHNTYSSNYGGPQKNNFGMINFLRNNTGTKINDNDNNNNNNINLPPFNMIVNGTNSSIIWSLIVVNNNNNSN